MEHKTFISSLSRQIGMSQADTERMLNSLSDSVKTAAANLDTIAIPGFGRFESHKQAEFVGVDPNDGVTKLFPPKIQLLFVAGSMLKKRFSHE